jgi:hypothetical protein
MRIEATYNNSLTTYDLYDENITKSNDITEFDFVYICKEYQDSIDNNNWNLLPERSEYFETNTYSDLTTYFNKWFIHFRGCLFSFISATIMKSLGEGIRKNTFLLNTSKKDYSFASYLTVNRTETQYFAFDYNYIIEKPEVMEFIDLNSFLKPVLFEAYYKIKRYFPNSKLILRMLDDPESPDFNQLILGIRTNLKPTEALAKLVEFDESWWLDRVGSTQNMLCITLEWV